ncbi:hypothetical protein NDU88_001041 [Pleurodeles waltl]|uniref:Uncharacterized protein n=1 Tax=Pleurodeles waltl TaxID=8319 RepID=A0AAV7PBD7_PLEWA|nr:hypothetical protein NDU88_001041 [Pleurodeles waltl]
MPGWRPLSDKSVTSRTTLTVAGIHGLPIDLENDSAQTGAPQVPAGRRPNYPIDEIAKQAGDMNFEIVGRPYTDSRSCANNRTVPLEPLRALHERPSLSISHAFRHLAPPRKNADWEPIRLKHDSIYS